MKEYKIINVKLGRLWKYLKWEDKSKKEDKPHKKITKFKVFENIYNFLQFITFYNAFFW